MLTKATGNWTKKEARHLLSRAGFGGSPEDVESFHRLGREKVVNFLLEPTERIDAIPKPEWANIESVRENMMEAMEMRREVMSETEGMSREEADKARRAAQREIQQKNRRQGLEGQGWWFRKMLTTDAPLREKMTLFWHDHFATSIQKVKQPALMIVQNELFREHAFGNFRELTQDVVRDPAMMLYLDTQRSSKAQPNENFAREVMELFTLGEGNYSEEDVKNAARAFTGYRLNRLTGEVVQNVGAWDGGEKEIFGETGKFNGSDVVKLIFRKDRCADFMAEKVWEFFAYENPDDEIVVWLGKVLRDADYEMKPLLKAVFLSAEFYSEKAVGTQIKCPVQYLVQMLKELEMESPPMGLAITGQVQLGQVLFMPPNVAGWDWGKAWINTNTLLTRYNIAGNLTKGSYDDGKRGDAMRGRARDRMAKRAAMNRGGAAPVFSEIAGSDLRNHTEELVDSLIERFFSVPIPAQARKSFLEYAESKKGGTFTDKELGELCQLMLSTPYYQLC